MGFRKLEDIIMNRFADCCVPDDYPAAKRIKFNGF
jgi:hypothetical protein